VFISPESIVVSSYVPSMLVVPLMLVIPSADSRFRSELYRSRKKNALHPGYCDMLGTGFLL